MDLPIISFRAGQIIFQQGEPGPPAYIICSGEVSLSRQAGKQRREIARLGKGDFFGELDGQTPTATTAESAGDCTLLRLDRVLLASMLQQRPEVGLVLLAQLNARWQKMVLDHTVTSKPRLAAPTFFLSIAMPNGIQPSRPGEALPIAAGTRILVGRADPSSPEKPDFDLGSFEGGDTVSRRHAMIELREQRLWIRELSQVSNGTFVNGKRIPNGEDVEIYSGDEVRFGLVKILISTGAGKHV